MTDNTKNVHQRLAQVMETVTYVRKEQKKGMNYSIVSHDVVTAKVRPALLAAGIVYYPVRCDHSHNGNRAECSMTVRFVNIDSPDDYFDVPTFGYGIDPQDKGPGKAMSYAVKYALLKALGLETGDDPDHDSIDHGPDPSLPTPQEIAGDFKKQISAQSTLAYLAEYWKAIYSDVERLPQTFNAEVTAAKDKRKAELSQRDAA